MAFIEVVNVSPACLYYIAVLSVIMLNDESVDLHGLVEINTA